MPEDSGGAGQTSTDAIFDLSDISPEQAAVLRIPTRHETIIFIPLDSIGVTNSPRDIVDDLGMASWCCEQLAACGDSVAAEHDYPVGTHKTRIKLTIAGANGKLAETLGRCSVVYTAVDDDDEAGQRRFQDAYETVLAYRGQLESGIYHARVPEVIDWYMANLIGGALWEILADAPDLYDTLVSQFPERRTGFWKSAFSSRLATTCYASPDSWILPRDIEPDVFFQATRQQYRMSNFIRASVLTIDNASYVTGEGVFAFFPMAQYFRSRACVSLTREFDEDEYPVLFDWSKAAFSHSPWLDAFGPTSERSDAEPVSGRMECLVDPDSTLVIVGDGEFRYLMYDTRPVSMDRIKHVHHQLGLTSEALAGNIGLSFHPKYDWAALDDERFEELCYDLIFAHPRFNSETIRKHGKSRSRDGGRDIEVYETVRYGASPRKWIFQCKLVTSSASLSATKLQDIGDLIDHYGVGGFGVMTSAPIDATLYDKLDGVCSRRGVEQLNYSGLEIERSLVRNQTISRRYFPRP
ncbi:hypothetical protein [Brevundimonas sp.]|uniref:hypothetical protein n=1 Tax=Brevundimonas sp. TaxID=1871086 RepID=UPI003D14FED4